ncbi:hypothetical protein V8E36_001221 [Tilletia maclaganii]
MSLGVLIPPLRFSVVAAVGPSQLMRVASKEDDEREDDAADDPSSPYYCTLSKSERCRQAQLSETIYRGTYPKPRNLPFLSRLSLRTVLSLTPKPPAELGSAGSSATSGKEGQGAAAALASATALKAWADAQGIRLLHVHVPSIKDRSLPALPVDDAHRILNIITDRANLPLYIHCLDGVEVTALATALFRKSQHWHPDAIAEEFLRHMRDPATKMPQDIVAYISRFEVGPSMQTSDDKNEDEEEEDEEEEEEEEEDDEDDDALEALDLEGY